ncbi:Copper transporter 2 [Sesamum angolense]|uniref:Copper transport protein n=1 Tax=Sesamum angolense TaxID=2727404 RepID=A0AAE1XAZ6_9LAMI|nr:Copper transporter 2 [Sesamum angolense]
MPGMEGMVPPPPPPSPTDGMDHQPQHTMTSSHAMMHMTFFWGKNAEILFSGWPGTRTGMYVLALIFVFVLSVIVEWLSRCGRIDVEGRGNFGGGLIRTVVHGVRIGVGYLVMLAVMSFNVGVLIAAVAGHTFGFFLFGSRVFKKSGTDNSEKGFSPPAGC